ncbi:MAG: T9SS type A sorting domain-containing protein [Ignavibacteria bacterium]|nr:T9SS type A sorting domain-containing protein [Ignavibacteria bacterium]
MPSQLRHHLTQLRETGNMITVRNHLSRMLFLTSFLIVALDASGRAEEYPELPRVYMQTAYNPPAGGQRIAANSSATFRAALTAAQPGDIIELAAGVTFTGPFTLPNKAAGSGWIYIVSSAYASLPAPCSRVTPADAPHMPKIVVRAGSGGAVATAAGAHHYRFVGIEFAPVDGNFVYNIVQIGNGETSAATQPNNIVIDRCYVHGDPAAGSRRGVLMNGASIAVIDSHVSDCKEDGADSQALAAYSGTGPVKIVNNYLEGAGENVMFGGADPSIPDAVPSDIEIRCNHFFKPLSWMGQSWDIKNLFELKNARRVLVEGNRFENNWPHAQNGFALLLTPRNQNNTAPWSAVQDVTIRFNTFVNIAQGINILGRDAPNVSQRTARILIRHNVLQVTKLGSGGDGRLFQILGGPTDVVFDHNTGFCTNAYIVADGTPKTDNFVFRNNIVTHGTYGFIGSGTAWASTTLAKYFNPNWSITANADIGGSPTNYPAGNFFPATIAAVGFMDYAAGDYRLSATSTFKNRGTDGRDLGADIDSIALASIYRCDAATGIDEEQPHKFECTLYPNPANGRMVLRTNAFPGEAAEVVVCDRYGRQMHRATVHAPTEILDISRLRSGVYFVQVTTRGASVVRRLVVLR